MAMAASRRAKFPHFISLSRRFCTRETIAQGLEAHPNNVELPSQLAKDKHTGLDEHVDIGKRNFAHGTPSRGKEKKKTEGSINFAETAKFAAIADTWWDAKGPYRPLHMLNPVRLSFIRSVLCSHFRKDQHIQKPLEGLTIVDVGCGGGILCEPLARMGAQVTGIDAVEKNIQVAHAHSIRDPVTSSISYHCATAEKLVQDQQQFDVVIALEVIEHVADPMEFVSSLSRLARDGGAVVISTINRSIRSYVFAIVAAEYLLNWLPRGTHDWSKLVTPDEVSLLMSRAGLSLQKMAGMVFNPLTGNWSLSEDTNVNYIAFGTRGS